MMRREIKLLLAAVVLCATFCLPSRATQIEYSWSGLILHDELDPWQYGAEAKDFHLHVDVSSDAPDEYDQNVELTGFYTTNVDLKIDGQTVPYAGHGFIDFADNTAGFGDIVTFEGDFTQLGQTLEIGSVVVLPVSTFALTQLLEPPPLFAPIENMDRASCCGGPYTAVVPAGNFVSVVPEPSAASMILGMGVVLVAYGWRWK